MARIAGVNIPQNKLVRIGLTYIFGIGEKNSNDICKSLNIPNNKRVNELSDDEILSLNIPTGTPLVYELGEDLNPVTSYYLGDQDEINAKIKSVASQGKSK